MNNGVNIPSKEFRLWHRSHLGALKELKRKHGTFTCPVSISVGISFKDLHRRDLDNALTSVLDLVKDAEIVDDDDWGHVPRVTAEAVNFGEHYAIVTIAPLQPQPWYRKLYRKIFK